MTEGNGYGFRRSTLNGDFDCYMMEIRSSYKRVIGCDQDNDTIKKAMDGFRGLKDAVNKLEKNEDASGTMLYNRRAQILKSHRRNLLDIYVPLHRREDISFINLL